MLPKPTFDGPVMVASGPRAAEERLLEAVAPLLPSKIDALGPPVRIIVPSRSLRRHLLRVLARRFGAVVGLVVQTHRGLALEIVERSGTELPAGGARFQDLLARAFAAGEPALQETLAAFDDGFAPVVAAVRDLMDAAFDAGNAEGVMDAIAQTGTGPDAERAAAVVRVATRCREATASGALGHRNSVFELATRALQHHGPGLIESRGILVHGFAETTGLLGEFFDVLLAVGRTRCVIDHPPDPVDSIRRDPGWIFTERLTERLARHGKIEAAGAPRDGPAGSLEAFTAPGPDAEIREIADRIRIRLDQGVEAEDIGVVFRRLDSGIIAAVRRHFGRLGIPFSGEGAAAPGGATARRATALMELLIFGEEARTGSWLGAAAWVDDLERREIDVALRAVGAGRLRQARAITVSEVAGSGALRLPVVEGTAPHGEGERPRRRTVSRASLERAVADAHAVAAVLQRRPDRAPVGDFFAWINTVLDALGKTGRDSEDDIRRGLDRLEDQLPGGFEVGWAELQPMLSRALDGLGATAIGGDGGGVQVLSVVEARGRTFSHLFLPQLNRGVFPARVADDPVLPTPIRRAMAPTLPDLPLKSRDRPEERYLFAQLMDAAPTVTVSWQAVDSDGRELNPSVFVERLRLGGRLWWDRGERDDPPDGVRVESVCDVFDSSPRTGPRPLLEYAVADGIRGRGAAFDAAVARMFGGSASHRLAVIDELDPPRRRDQLVAFFGAVGTRRIPEIWVSGLDAMARCPWRWFLERELGLEAPPEASFAEEGLSGAMVGLVVHEVLERIAVDQGVSSRGSLDELRDQPAVRIVWPRPSILDPIVAEVAGRVAADNGKAAMGPALAAFAHSFLRRARDLAWPEGEADVVGVETVGRFDVEQRSAESGASETTTVRFRADRVDREAGGLVLIDFKTGEPADLAPKTAVPRGRLFQGVVYALAGGEGAVGRYVVLKDPEKMAKSNQVNVHGSLTDAGREALEITLAGGTSGILFPRLSDVQGRGDGPECRWCPLKPACLNGESGVGPRLASVMAGRDADDALRQLWELPIRSASSSKRAKK